jgi:hypothetical protein
MPCDTIYDQPNLVEYQKVLDEISEICSQASSNFHLTNQLTLMY